MGTMLKGVFLAQYTMGMMTILRSRNMLFVVTAIAVVEML
jgi:hypothetical protein